MFCKNIASLAVARKRIYVWQPLATAKWATFLQNILWKSCSKFNFKQCSLKKFLKILIFWREYMEMCFHGNQISWGINHSFISLYSKYQPPSFICSSIMLAPVISSLDEIYCTSSLFFHINVTDGVVEQTMVLEQRLHLDTLVHKVSYYWGNASTR